MRLLIVLGCATILFAEPKPANLPVSTWVREDLFAGFMVNDLDRFQAGMKKLDQILAAEPDSADAIAWQAGAKLYLAVRAHEAGDAAKFKALFAEARQGYEKARAAAEKSPAAKGAVYAIIGGSFTLFADRMPADLRKDAWTTSRDNYLALKETQKAFFDKLPLHMRGEVLAGLAQASQRLGEPQDKWSVLVNEMIAALPDSTYASRGKKWLESPDVAARSSMVCQTCHDAGRLEAVTARMNRASGGPQN